MNDTPGHGLLEWHALFTVVASGRTSIVANLLVGPVNLSDDAAATAISCLQILEAAKLRLQTEEITQQFQHCLVRFEKEISRMQRNRLRRLAGALAVDGSSFAIAASVIIPILAMKPANAFDGLPVSVSKRLRNSLSIRNEGCAALAAGIDEPGKIDLDPWHDLAKAALDRQAWKGVAEAIDELAKADQEAAVARLQEWLMEFGVPPDVASDLMSAEPRRP